MAKSMSSMQASGKRSFADGEPVADALVGAHGDLAIEHQAEPLVAAEFAGAVLFGKLPPGGRHAG